MADFLVFPQWKLSHLFKRLIHNYATFYGSFLQKVTQSDAGTPFVWVPEERQQFNDNKEARPERESDFNV